MPKSHPKSKQPFYIKNFKILIILLILVIVIPGYFFLVKPKYDDYQINKPLLDQSRQELEQKKQQLTGYAETLSTYEKISQIEEEKIDSILPSSIDKPSLYVNLESLVESVDLTLNSIDIQAIEKKELAPTQGRSQQVQSDQPAPNVLDIKDELALVQIDLSLSDVSYLKLKELLPLLETNLRLLDVQNLSFNPIDGSLGLSLQAYYLN